MSDTSPPDPTIPQVSPYRELQFDGDRLVAVLLEGDGVAVPVRLVCQALGLDVGSQSERLQSHDVLSVGLRIVRIRQGNQLRPVVALQWINDQARALPPDDPDAAVPLQEALL